MSLANQILSRIRNLQPVANSGDLRPNTPPVNEIVKRVSFIEGGKFDSEDSSLIDTVKGFDWIDTHEPHRHNEHFIHVSDLRDVCPRAYVLAVRHGSKRFKSDFLSSAHTSATRVVWAQGRASEEHIRKQFIRAHANQVYGTWECACKSSRYLGVFNSSLICTRCEARHNFNETPIFDQQLRMVGTADFPVVDSTGMVIYELKSIKKDDFEELNAPLPEHLVQVFTYHDMAKRSGFGGMKLSHKVGVIYAAKEFSVKGCYKEYPIDTRDEQYDFVKSTMQILYAKAKLIQDCLRDGTLPPLHSKCHFEVGSKIPTQAKGCPLFVNCMSLK